ncbi:hypothetical protein EMIHUDRAFT_451139 [Emiliania huxleyi CCMP1516]|uniref:Response regulatory domain-containing protein n=2 Tax=Emiliania huxleyi TaxID=2903 RepID=A0A0D3J7N4_EMIH1|nr:hypothetical protein EMIHUDRAFT_451139 [Emiliania huxleyi CCMP1516]EOD19519.1 hypothetical protein EMIHUDRAFT_451139 [Emiliania huxleyi CCMP1516]|eukprot:XP_005771948.1 hypothetical protein EMIHUDRAFT_451139 [Emiliania huxleyi CCMP1516]
MPPPSSASHGLPSEILEMLGRVQDQAMIFSFTVDENNENARFPYASPGAQAVYGVSAEEVMSDAMELVGRIHDDDQRSYFSSVEESWKQLSEWNFTWRSRFPGYPNNYKWLKASSMPKRLPNGHTIWYGAVYDADAETRLGDSEKRQTESAASNRLLQSENDSISNKRVYESSKSFGEYFQLGGEKRFLDTVDDGAVLRELLAAARHEMQPIRDLAVFKPTHSSNERTLRCRAVDLSGVEGFTSVLVAEKDRQVAAKLQHEDKNLHKSHEFQSPELKKVWLDLEAVREHSFEAIRQAKATLATMQTRSKRAQEDAHLRIMIFQMAAQEYVPLSLPVDVVASVVAEFGADAGVCVQLDWHLLRYALENAVSNARKYGTDMEIELAIEYHEPTLVMQVSNAADPQKQAQLIARHGTNATRLLHHRGNTGGAHSTNLGGQAMRDVARLLRGSVSLQLLPAASRLHLEATQPLLVYFIDDEPTMRMVYGSWVRSPSPLHPDSKVFPPPDLPAAETDEAMRGFAGHVLAARPRPSCVVLDQNLRSQVMRRENATTGTEIATALRAGGYKGSIVIRSANVSQKVINEYLSAGASAVMQKDEPRERLVQLIVEAGGALPKEFASDSEQEAGLLVGEHEGIWGSVSDAEERAAILSEFRRGVRRTLDDLLALLDARDVGALPDELHHLLGQCRAVGARRIQLAVGKCKSAFDYGKLVGLEELLAETFEAMDARCGGEPLESTAAQCSHAKQLADRLAPLVGGPPDKSPPSATPSKHSSVLPPSQPLQRPQRDNTDALPLVNWEIARALGDALNAACVECESTLEKLHKALVSCGEQCELLLRSLVGCCEQIGATRMARLVVDFESRHTEFGPLQLDALRTLHAETLSALSAPEGLLAASASALRGTTLSELSAPEGLLAAGASALRGTSPPRTSRLKPAEEGLFVAVVDDSAFSRKIFEATLLPALGADAQRSKAIGGTKEEQVGFISFALGLVDASLHDLPPPHRQADVVLIDENLALDGEVHLSGSYVLARLREQGYVGVACLASSCDREQLKRLMAVPGVDLVSPKPFHASALAAALLKAHEVKQLVTSAHATQEKRAPFAEKLVSLTHLEGLPHSSIRSLMDVAYNNATEPSSHSSAGKRPRFLSASSVYAKLAQLEKRFQQSESTDQVCHSLKGVAKTAGACRLAKEVQAFSANPTTAGIAQMWSLLDATRSKLLATGYLSLPSDPVSPTLPHIAHRWKKNHSSFSA